MSSRPDLKLAWCSHKAVKYAVEHWHYSRRMPRFKLVSIGAWEDGQFVGAVIFGQGATPEIGKPFGMSRLEVCELVRVALRDRKTPTSRIVAIALRMLHRHCPQTRLVVSFADSAQGHIGTIYQAGGWVYVGSYTHHAYLVGGVIVHPKTLHSRYGIGGQSIPWLRKHIDPVASRINVPPKYKYVMAFDQAGQDVITPLGKPYPKRAGSDTGDTPAVQAGEGGSTPTPALTT